MENYFEYFVDAIQADCRCTVEDAEDIAIDFAIDFANRSNQNDVDSQYNAWHQLVDEYMLGDMVANLTKQYDAELLFFDILQEDDIASY